MIPFKAALFDLDGTLLDSMYVWNKVDEDFFAKRGMAVPEDYGRKLAGLSFRETAEFTVEHYLPDEKPSDLMLEWTEMSQREYVENVPLKKGALSYLRMLKREGIRLAVTTALSPGSFKPCLKRLGILELFEAFCSTDDTNGKGKACGEIYRLAAEKLGLAPEDCAVFEDVPAGIQGAKAAGMKAYCVRDASNAKDFAAMEAAADGMVDSLDEMERYHDFPRARRCVIFTAYCEGNPAKAYQAEDGDYVLCADGGWKIAERAGAKPALVIGDFDSSEVPTGENIETHPVMKDDTDTMLCIRHGLRMGYDRFLVIGGFGGRLDHTFANLQTMVFAAECGTAIEMADEFCRAAVVKNGTVTVKKYKNKLSVFSMGECAKGVTLKGTLYPLEDGELTNAFPIGVSNEFLEDEAQISVREGTLLLIQTQDR